MQKIVVVDDEEGLRQTIVGALRSFNYDAVAAEDGASGLEIIRSFRPDLILSDVMMPGTTGYDLLATLQKEPALAAIPVILMTGQADLAGLRQGMSLGADDYLPKPFSLDDLIAAVRKRLEKKVVWSSESEARMTALRDNLTLMLPHELLTPLSGIIGVADLLSANANNTTPEELAEYAGMLKQSGERLHHLTERFLTYAQLEVLAFDPEAGAKLSRREPENQSGVIAARAQAQAKAAGRLEDLKLDLHDAPLRLLREHVCRVIDELVGNAFKFSPPGTPVIVVARPDGRTTRIMISDFGRGMEAKAIGAIGAFSQFNRKIQEQQGAGLGLIIAKRLVELHGGSFHIASEPRSGTTITMSFPAGKENPPGLPA